MPTQEMSALLMLEGFYNMYLREMEQFDSKPRRMGFFDIVREDPCLFHDALAHQMGVWPHE